ncbi:hypothetical protein H8E06_00595 [bacterium]|nr:hypothetical protein [bacterium]
MTSNTVTIDGQDYLFAMQLVNPEFRVIIPYGKVIDFTVVESLYSTFPIATLIIDNTHELIENYTEKVQNIRGQVLNKSYRWYEDGQDLIEIKIRPVVKDDPTASEQTFPSEAYEMSYLFSVVNESSVSTTTNEKAKRLDLVDVREMILMEKTTCWSTNKALVEENGVGINLTQKSNDDRKVGTGAAIKNFLKTCFGPNQKFTKDWDPGRTKIYYSTPGTATDITTLLTLLDSHVSHESKDNCILRSERNGYLSFVSYESYFKGALTNIGPNKKGPGLLLIDAFSLPYEGGSAEVQATKESTTEDVNETYDVNSPDFVPPQSRISYDIGQGATWSDFEGIEGYNYSNFHIPGSVSEFASLQVHNTDIKKKQFNIENKDSFIDNARAAFKKMYVDHFHGLGGKPVEIYPSNDLKTNNRIVNNVFTLNNDKDYRLKIGRNSILAKAIGFAPAITLDVKGSIPRIPGRFISLFGAPTMDTVFQDRVQGEWFIVNMVHKFTPGKYRNNITCTKHYSYK